MQSLPTFSTIDFRKVPDELESILNKNRAKLQHLLESSTFSWENLLEPIETMNDELHQYWTRVNHMNAVVNSPALREAYNTCLPKLSDYYTELSHNEKLYQAIKSIADSTQFSKLDKAQQKVITNELRDFKLAGVALPFGAKKQFATLVKELNQLQTQFEENLLDATNAWSKRVTDKSHLAGIPQSALDQAEQRAKGDGWLLNLETPCYLAVMMNADSRELREEFYHAYVTRASEQSDNKQWNNSQIIHEILKKRLALAQLLGFENYAQKSLATKMAESPNETLKFLNELADVAHPKAKQEYETLCQFARETLNLEKLEAWDVAYVSEKLRKQQFDFSQEELRSYFAENAVINGFFLIVNQLFHIHIKPVDEFDTWHPDVKCYAVYNQKEELISYFYFDLYARPKKRGGAWMDDCRIRRKLKNGDIQLPIAFITCNFNSPTKNCPALLTHDEVITLFHEFGHALQHMLTTVDYADISGINGIPWDAVELASQFLENWAWEQESLDLFAHHYKTGEKLPEKLYQKMFKAKNFQSAMQMVRQLEFSLFDMELHIHFNPEKNNQPQTILDAVRKKVSAVPAPSFNRFQNGFSHIFSGGYAAGYYSYKWAEVMACDAFSLFIEKGIFDQASANKFLTYILQPGGSEEPAILYKKYRGRTPKVESLLQQTGIIS